jgi:nicotinamidase-related amidase
LVTTKEYIMSNVEELSKIYSSKKFGRKMGFGDKPALLVIDFIKAFTDERTHLGANFDRQLEQTKRILAEARVVGIPIIFTTVAYEPDLKDTGVWGKKVSSELLVAGTNWVEIDPILARRPNEPIIIKKYPSAFFGTDLISRLNTDRVDTIIVTGCTTSGCVRATVVDGVSYGFRMMIVEQAVGDRAELTHQVNLADMNAKYGDVVSVDSVLEYLAAQPRK